MSHIFTQNSRFVILILTYLYARDQFNLVYLSFLTRNNFERRTPILNIYQNPKRT